MKTTKYFEYTRKRPDRAQIKEDWIKFVIESPEEGRNSIRWQNQEMGENIRSREIFEGYLTRRRRDGS